jgi:N-acetylgalactosamine-N,N'-diacetylbacillosaminyl-diphospho-undecaprenol 4-alpha-N-acetylgalactosaminyltransferase
VRQLITKFLYTTYDILLNHLYGSHVKKKKIAFLINSLGLGGAERVVSLLLERMNNHPELEFELILLENEIFYELPKDIKVTILSNLTWQDSALKRTLYIPLLAYRLKRYIKKNDIKFVLSFIYRADFVNVLASFLTNYNFALSNRVNASSTYSDNSLTSKINNFLIKTLYPKAPLVINVSHGLKNDLTKNYNIEDKKQFVIYNPYDIEKIKKLSNEPLELELEREKTIVVASRLDPVKNIPMILRAFSNIEEPLKLIIIGDGADTEKLKALSSELKIDDRVIFTGLQNNPYRYMKNSAIYISASNSEGFPNALVEAMICQCAVISTDCKSGPREILAPSSDFSYELKEGIEVAEYGILTAINDQNALENAIKFYIQSSEKRLKYSKLGYKRAKDFDIDIITEKYINRIKKGL